MRKFSFSIAGAFLLFAIINLFSTAAPEKSLAVFCCDPPDAVADLSATAGDAEVVLTWSAPFDGGDPITDYVVQYGATAGFPGNAATFSDGVSATTGATVTSLTNGTDYSFRVAAVNGEGQGPYSNVDTATPVGAGPGSSSDSDINVDVNDFLSFAIANPAADCTAAAGGNCPFGSGAAATDLTSTGTNAFSYAVALTQLAGTTNSTDGYNVTVFSVNTDTRTQSLLRSGGAAGTAADQITDSVTRLPAVQAANEALTTGADTGLAFRLKDTTTSAILREADEDTQWGINDAGAALWAGLPLGTGVLAYDTVTFSAATTTAYIDWFVGVAASQQTGTYNGIITFTASVN